MATVPIVTEVTKAQLDALVAANGLNEGLQYKVTDKDYNVLATSENTYIITGAIPYKKWVGTLLPDGTNDPIVNVFENTIGNIVWTRASAGLYYGTLAGALPHDRFYTPTSFPILDIANLRDGEFGIFESNDDNSVMLTVANGAGAPFDGWVISAKIEIRVYY